MHLAKPSALVALLAATATAIEAPLEQIDTFARYATAAYCERLGDAEANSQVCGRPDPETCGALADATTVTEFNSSRTITGNIAVSSARKVIVVTFRGTGFYGPRDVVHDLRICLRQPKKLVDVASVLHAVCGIIPGPEADEADPLLPLCPSCRVHTGFWTAFRGIKDDMLAAVNRERAVPAQADFAVVATGHSLGGAVATIAGAYLRKAGVPADIYTYGSPRVGDAAFATFVSEQTNGRTYRVVNRADPVAVVPGLRALYAHTTPEFWFPDSPSQPESMRVCEGVSNVTCSAQFRPSPFKADHHGSAMYARGFDACPGRRAKELDEEGGMFSEENVQEWMKLGLVDDGAEEAV